MKDKLISKNEVYQTDSSGINDVAKESILSTNVIKPFTRRLFLNSVGLGAVAIGLQQIGCKGGSKPAPAIQGLANVPEQNALKGWVSVSNRKIRVGLVGHGFCKFGVAFGFQNHPNVEVVAVSDLFPDRCAEMAKIAKCKKTYPSLEELVKDDSIEAVFLATDAPSHQRHCLEVLKHGKHVGVCVPAVWGSLEDAEELYDAVKKSGLKYMMFETSYFYEDLYAMRQIYKAGGFGKLIYTEGEYLHYLGDYMYTGFPSYKEWRHDSPPQWYPTHSNAFYVGVTDGSFTEVSCMGVKCKGALYQPGSNQKRNPWINQYNNPFATEMALFRTSEGGLARMGLSHDTPGLSGEMGRCRGERGSFNGKYEGLETVLPNLTRPPLPPGVEAGGHGGSHGRLTDEFITSILLDRKPLVDIASALNMTVAGIVAHSSALKDGELMKIPQYKFL